uniref:RNA polymerase beta'' subunit n=1 Tax=Stigeoclonium helveticum TaxID=55999 RepID=UPI00017E10C4|nr:RNA polymerase beta'' subunit [Stigeoclonium helveticum]
MNIFSDFSLYSLSPKKKTSLTDNKIVSFATKDFPQVFWNLSFNKGSLKNFVFWCFVNYGQRETIKILEKLQIIGFGYATKAGISLSIDDLKIPPTKAILLADADKSIEAGFLSYKKSQLTGLERFQRIIETWHKTSESLKDEMITNFRQTDSLNPVYMMAFSGARGNVSQVRQLVAMRGLMSDPQGKILDFPIRSNFREGLTLTEYVISCYGARKGVVDTALRTANAGYLTRRLVDVAQHVIVLNFDCGTKKGFYLTEMKKFNKTLYPLRQRLLGRVLAANLYNVNPFHLKKRIEIGEKEKNLSSLPSSKGKMEFFPSFPQASLAGKASCFPEPQIVAFRNQEISEPLAEKISKITNKVFIRSPLTCDTPRLVCQLCYGWSLSEGYLVSIGEAVGIIAAQSIGEPGTQLTMRTFHTGGVFAGEMFDQLMAPYDGIVQYSSSIPGTLVRTTQGKIAFLTKVEGKLSVFEKNNSTFLSNSNNGDNHSLISHTISHKSFKLPAYTLLFIRNNETISKDQLIAELAFLSSKGKKKGEIAEFIVKSEIEGQLYSGSVNILEKYTDYNDIMTKSIDWGSVWILSGKICQLPVNSSFFALPGDLVDENAILSQIQWVVPMKSLLDTNSLIKPNLKKEIYFDFSLNQTKWFQKRNLENLNTLFNLKFGIEKKNRTKKRVLSQEKKSDFLNPSFSHSSRNYLYFSLPSKKTFSYYPFAYFSKIKEKNGGRETKSSFAMSGWGKKSLSFFPSLASDVPKLLSDFYPTSKKRNFKSFEKKELKLSSFSQTIFFNQDKSLLLKMKIKIQTISDFTKVSSKMITSRELKKNGMEKGKNGEKENSSLQRTFFSQGAKAPAFPELFSFFSSRLFPILPFKSSLVSSTFSHNSQLCTIRRQNKLVLSGNSNQFENFAYLKDKITINLPLIFLCIDNIYYKKIGYFFSLFPPESKIPREKFLPEEEGFSPPSFGRTFKNKNLAKLKDVFFVPKLLEQRNIISTKKKNSFKKNNQISNQLLHWFPKSYLTMKGGICVYRLTHDFFCQYINFHSSSFLFEKKRGTLICNVDGEMNKPVSSNILGRICWVNQDYKKTKLYTLKFFSYSKFIQQLTDRTKRLQRQIKREKKIGQADFFQTVLSMSQAKEKSSLQRTFFSQGAKSRKKVPPKTLLSGEMPIFSLSPSLCGLKPAKRSEKEKIWVKGEKAELFSLSNAFHQPQHSKKHKYSSFSLNFYKNLTSYCLKNKDKSVANCFSEKKKRQFLFFSEPKLSLFPDFLFSKSEKNIFYNANKKKYSFFYLKKTNSSKKSLTNNSIMNGFIYKPKDVVSAISLHKKFFLPGQKIIDDLSFDNFLIYVECIPEDNLSSLSETLYKSRFDKKICFNLKKLITNKMPRFIKIPTLLSTIPFAFLKSEFKEQNEKIAQRKADRQKNNKKSEAFFFKSNTLVSDFDSPFLSHLVVLITKVIEYPLYKPNHYKKALYNRQKTSEQSFFHYSCKVKSKMLNKIFKNNYHSNVLNKQTSSLRLLDKFPNTDLVLALKCKGIQKDLMENFLKNPLNLNLYVKLGKQKSFGKEKDKTFSVSQPFFKSSAFKKEKKSNSFSQAKAFDFNLTSKKSRKKANKLVENLANGKKSRAFPASKACGKLGKNYIFPLEERKNGKKERAKASSFPGLLSFSHLAFPIFFRKSFSKFFCMKFFSKSSIQLLELVLVGVQKNSVNNKIIGITVFNFFQKNKLKEEEKKRQEEKEIFRSLSLSPLFLSHLTRKKNSDFFSVSKSEALEKKKLQLLFFSHAAFPLKEISKNYSSKASFLSFFHFLDKKIKKQTRRQANFVVSAFEKSDFSFDPNINRKKKYFSNKAFNYENIKIMNNNISQSILQPNFYFNYYQKYPFGYYLINNINVFAPSSFSFSSLFSRNTANFKNYFLFYQLLSMFNRPNFQLHKSMEENLLQVYEQSTSYFSLISCFFQQPCFDAFFTQQVSFGFNEVKNVNHYSKNLTFSKKIGKRREFYLSPFLRSKIYFKKNSFSEQGEIALTQYLSPFMGEILNHENYYWSQNTQKNRYLLLTKKDQISFLSTNYNTQKESINNSSFFILKNKKNTPNLGEFLTKGDCCFISKSQNSIISSESGLIVHSNKSKITLRKAQSFFLSPNCIFHYSHGDLVEKNKSILSLPYEQLKTGDIVQGIPKVEQLLEARSTFKGKEEEDNLHKLLKYAFELYKTKFSLKLSVRKSFSFIQLILVNSVQRIYRSQGVSISDKHLEVIVKQMTSKVQITSRGDSSFFRGEHVDLYIVETWNALHPQLKKICYKPILLGISRSSLEVNSFLSAASFQHTKKVLSRSAFKTNIDFLNGLKENVIIGNLISAGTGNLNN